VNSSILLTGGTGTLGRLVAPLLRDAGCRVRVLSRNDHESDGGIEYVTGDLTTGAGIDAALDGVRTVVHCAGSQKGDDDKTRNLVRAARDVRHLVYISVVGADRVPVVSAADRAMFGYFAAKRAAERVVAESGLPWTTLRATQFHDLLLTTVRQMVRIPVVPVPVPSGVRFQPVDAAEVAERLTGLALGRPSGLVPDIAGPRVYEMTEVVRGYLRATGRRRPIVPVRLPGRAARAFRAGANLATEHATGRRTWEEFLAEQLIKD
jgi:uncharacterized protein YbjT (DUF2867 family)